MKTIKPPTCTQCEHFRAEIQSERWPSIKLCRVCHDKVLIFFATQMPELCNNNPLANDLLRVDSKDLWRMWTMDRLNGEAREIYSRLCK